MHQRLAKYIQPLLILALCVSAAVVYGVLHDQVTARVCLEYFTRTHPRLVDSTSPTIVALAWGVVATWWAGVFIGIPLAAACRVGSEPRLGARDLVKPLGLLLAAMGVCALGAGVTGWWLSKTGRINVPFDVQVMVPREKWFRWMGDWWAHNASYLSGFAGGIGLCVWVVAARWRRSRRGRRVAAAGNQGQSEEKRSRK